MSCCSGWQYGGTGYVQCPDGDVIAERSYDGYGIFHGKDVFELVVDWNVGHLEEVLAVKTRKAAKAYFDLARAIDSGHPELCPGIARAAVSTGARGRFFAKNWKRCLGIEITSEDNVGLRYPIKITSSPHPRKRYANLPASISCQ